MKKILPFLILFAVLVSCKPKTETEVIELPALRASSLYKRDSVLAYMLRYETLHKAKADNYFQRALEEKASNPQKAVYLLKRAITLCPTHESYLELGRLLLHNQLYDEAQDLYNLLLYKGYRQPDTSYLFKKPDMEIYYGELVSNYFQYKYMDSYLIREARDNGIDIAQLRKKIFTDSRFYADTAMLAFKFFTDEDLAAYRESPANFKNYLAQFKDSSSAFEVNEKGVQKFDYKGFFSEYDGPDEIDPTAEAAVYLQERQENPNSWQRYNFKHIKRDKDFVAVIYAIDTSETACPIDMRTIYYNLVTYDHSGKVIDHLIVAKQVGEELSTLMYSANKYSITKYQRTWKKPYDKSDFDNELLKTELMSKEIFYIDPKGKIQSLSVPVADPS